MAKSFSTLKKEIDSMDRVTFGKHAGNTWFWVVENYPDYIIWCAGNTDMRFSYDLLLSAIKSKYAKKKVQDDTFAEAYRAMKDKAIKDLEKDMNSWQDDIPF